VEEMDANPGNSPQQNQEVHVVQGMYKVIALFFIVEFLLSEV
jgi:hypothetical protein